MKKIACDGIIVMLLVGCAVVARDSSNKIPISTKSEKAKELYLQGRDLQERLRFNEARTYFEHAIAEDHEFALAHFGYALTAPSAKTFFEYLGKAIELSENASRGEQLWIQGVQAGANGDLARQVLLFKELVTDFNQDERAHNILGGFYFRQQQWYKAIEEYEKSIEINPQFSQPYNQLGYAYRFLVKYEIAAKTFKKYISLIPDDPNPYDSYAELLLKMSRYDESIKNYRKALAIDPTFVASHIGIATNFNYKGSYTAARKQLDEMIGVAQNDGQIRGAHFARAVSFIFENDSDNALKEVQKMYNLAEKIKDAAAMSGDLVTMGNILAEFGKTDEALAKYKKSLKVTLESSLSDAQKQLAEQFHNLNVFNVAEKTGNIKLAGKHAKIFKKKAEAIDNIFQIRISHEMLGRIALMEKKYDTALTELKQANVQNPYNLLRTGLAYKGKGNAIKAKEWFDKAVNFNALNNMNQAFMSLRVQKMMSMK